MLNQNIFIDKRYEVRYNIWILEKYGKRRALHYGGRKKKHTDLRGLEKTGG